MNIETYIAGPIDANNYLLWDELSKEAILIDCSDFREDILQKIEQEKLSVKYILLTHGHFDHILGINKMKAVLNAKVGINKNDAILLEHTPEMCAMFGMPPEEPQEYDFFVSDGDILEFGQYKIKVFHTPGHTEGGTSYLIDDKLFCGDTVFRGSYGRTDLPGGNFKEIENSIKNIIFKLDENTEIFSGHGEISDIKYEKMYNDINS